jgi:hypothetical protein
MPGAFAVTYSVMVQPSISACVALLASGGRTAGTVVYAVIMLALWTVLPVYSGWVVLYQGRRNPTKTFLLYAVRPLKGKRTAMRQQGSLGERLRFVASYLLDPNEQWARRPTIEVRGRDRVKYAHQAEFLLENMEPVFGGYVEGREWFFMVDWGICISSACVLGAAEVVAAEASSSAAACDAATWGTACALCWGIAQLVVSLYCRPYRVRVELYFVLGIGLLAVLSEALVLGGLEDAAETVVGCGNIATVIAMVLLMLRAAMLTVSNVDKSGEPGQSAVKALVEDPPQEKPRRPHPSRPRVLHLPSTATSERSRNTPSREVQEQLRRLVRLACDAVQADNADDGRKAPSCK